MAKSKPADPGKRNKRRSKPHKTGLEKRSAEDLFSEAATLLQQSQPDLALPLAQRALIRLKGPGNDHAAQLPALLLLAQAALDLGDPDEARRRYKAAVEIDPEGERTGADPFLWLAQLSENGGQESVSLFQQGVAILNHEVGQLEEVASQVENVQDVLLEKRQKMVDALCGMVEVYMTDLSFDPQAEERCEAFITEALLLDPNSITALQTLANVRISQLRHEDAKSALQRSMALWMTLPPEDSHVPDFSSRIALSRLLMEVGMEADAFMVLERLVQEDDQSVEAWYLGGWCQNLQAQNGIDSKGAARDWLSNSLRLYDLQDYEDDRLRDHAVGLVEKLQLELGDGAIEEDEWEDDVEVEGEDGNIEVEGTGNALAAT